MCPLVDRCNFDAQQRSHFLSLAGDRISVDCIVADIDPETCLRRCMSREDHPTLPGAKASRVINGMSKDWKAPALDEGFRTISVIRDDATLRQVLSEIIPSKAAE